MQKSYTKKKRERTKLNNELNRIVKDKYQKNRKNKIKTIWITKLYRIIKSGENSKGIYIHFQ